MKWHKSKVGASYWVINADYVYVAARYLYWKGLIREFALLGAHAIELYLKVYLIQKTDTFPQGHNLVNIYQACMDYDDFFKEESIRKLFEPPKPRHTLGTDWVKYVDIIKYPEALPSQKRLEEYAIVLGGSHYSLDQIADFVRRNVDRPERQVDVVESLLKTDHYHGELVDKCGNLDEIREAFLRENDYFKK